MAGSSERVDPDDALVIQPEAPAVAAASGEPPAATPPAPTTEGTPSDATEKTADAGTQDATPTPPSLRDVWKGTTPEERAAALRDEDWDELVKSTPWLQGRIGSAKQRADREAAQERERTTAEIRAQVLADLEEQRKIDLAEADDLVGLGEIEKRAVLAKRAERAKTLETEQAEKARAAVRGEVEVSTATEIGNTVWDLVKDALKDEDQKELVRDWGPGLEGVKAFTAEAWKRAVSAQVERGIAERLPKLKAELEAAYSTEKNATALADEPSPDTRGGTNNTVSEVEFAIAAGRGESTDIARIARYVESLDDSPALAGRAGR